ncbi:hypothetical protein M0R72_00575 [Candidatus Pacearchaeota archaeon]|jgi:hypothetical protein|nr:hypothetical protein [Candidatus Pacearchaeota archaeon]
MTDSAPPPDRHSPEKVIEILRSISKLEIDREGVLDVWFEGGESAESIHSFIPGSFTRELLILIEEHLNPE